jgi:hypothetical protein
MSDPIDVIRDVAPPVGNHPELLERVRSDLMTIMTRSKTHEGHASDLRGSLATGVDSVETEADEQRVDELTVDYFQQRPDETYAPSEPNRWRGVVIAVAATILVVVGVVVVADGNSGNVVTDPASSPGVDDSLPTNERSGVPEDQPVFGGAGKQRIFSLSVGGPGLVAVGSVLIDEWDDTDAAVWTSVDGITWSRVPHDEAVFGDEGAPLMFDVTAGGPGLVAVGYVLSDGWDDTDAAVWTSVDGITWSRVPHDEALFGGGTMSSVTAGGPGLVAVGSAGSWDDAAVWTSVDGITWSRVPHDEAVFGGADNQTMIDVTVGGPGLVAVGADGLGLWDHSGGQVAAVWTSVDGITWSRVPHDEAVFGEANYESDEGANQVMVSVTVGGPGLVAVGSEWPDGAAVWTSVDGITWSRVPHDEAVFGRAGGGWMFDVTAGASGLVAVGEAVWTSVDGITWSRVPDFGEGLISGWSVTAGGPGLVAAGDAGSDAAVWTSVDGINWSRVPDDEATGETG